LPATPCPENVEQNPTQSQREAMGMAIEICQFTNRNVLSVCARSRSCMLSHIKMRQHWRSGRRGNPIAHVPAS
jgi:hypothetical protein